MSNNPAIISYINCDPDMCPISDTCPVGPTPYQPCEIKKSFDGYLNNTLASTFAQLERHPEVSLRLNLLLKPLFEQLLRLRMEEISNPRIMSGRFINPVIKEIRQTVLAIDKVLTEAVKAYYGIYKKKDLTIDSDPLGTTNKGYYEMLLTDGSPSVETNVGPSQ